MRIVYADLLHHLPYMTIHDHSIYQVAVLTIFHFSISFVGLLKKHIQLGIQPYKHYVDVPSSVWGPSGVFEIMGYTPEI